LSYLYSVIRDKSYEKHQNQNPTSKRDLRTD
jgi:hypothetical protein